MLTLRSFSSDSTIFVFLQQGPLSLIVINSTTNASPYQESEVQLRSQLLTIYTQIISTLTASQLEKIFSKHENFDLRRLLAGTEPFLDALCDELTYFWPSVLLNALECLTMRKSRRAKIDDALIYALLRTNRTYNPIKNLSASKNHNLLYGIIIADRRLVSIIRPRRHSLHPPDLYLLFSMLYNTSTFRHGEHWTPICLPKLDSKGFVHAYITFINPIISVVLISTNKDSFHEMKEMKENLMMALEKSRSIQYINGICQKGRIDSITAGAPSLRHFLYKSKKHVQYTMPEFFRESEDQKQYIMSVYSHLNQLTHRKDYNCRLLSINLSHNAIAIGWITNSFELYCISKDGVDLETVMEEINTLVKYYRQEENRVFLSGGAVF